MCPRQLVNVQGQPHCFVVALFAVALSFLLVSCGAGGMSCVGATPLPKLSSVAPTIINSGNLPASISLAGSGFVSWSTVFLNSVPLTTTMSDSHHLNATVTWQDLSAAGISSGKVEISVTNAGQLAGGLFGCPNGGSSQLIAITIQ
jgi:hypothetical protein